MPLSEPTHGLDGSVMNEIAVPAGTVIFIGNWMSNINRALWGEDVDEFKPERWLSPLPEALKEAHLPGVYSNL